MSTPLDMLFRRVAVEQRLLSPEQAERARHAQNDQSPDPPLPVVMVELGLLTHAQVAKLMVANRETFAGVDSRVVDRCRDWLLAALLVKNAWATTEAIHRGLREIGAREAAKQAPPSLGEAMLEQGALSRERLDEALARMRTTRRRSPVETALDQTARVAPAGADATVEDAHVVQPTRRRMAEPGARSFGKYEIVEVLGRGGMGVVYKAYHPGLKTYFALKVLLAGDDASSDQVLRFKREAHALARLHHPGIVGVHDIGEEDGKTYLAMEYVEGDTLANILEGKDPGAKLAAFRSDRFEAGVVPPPGNRKRSASGVANAGLPPRTAVRVLREMAEALAAAHAAGILHRDLKPANVLIDREGRVRLMDFGLAKMQGVDPTVATRTGELMGTPAYMSPEHVDRGMKDVDAQSDVYQLGAILYELLTGRRPHEGGSVAEVMMRVAQDDPVAPGKLRLDLDPDAETICLKAMAREKSARYASASAMAEDCRRYLAGEPIGARRETRTERAFRWVRRRKLSASLAAVALLALAVAAAAGVQTMMAQRARERAENEQAHLKEEMLLALRRLAETNLKGALLLRRAGGKMKDAEDNFLQPLRQAADEATAKAPALADPHYHVGRMLRALLRFDEALAAQDEALRKDPGYRWSRYERGMLLERRYEQRVRARQRDWWRARGEELALAGGGEVRAGADLRPPTWEELEDDEARALAARAMEDLRQAVAWAIGPGAASCAKGFLARLQGRGREAVAAFEEAVAVDPDLEEAYEALAHLAASLEGAPAAVRWFSRGLEHDKGFVPHLEGRAQVRLETGQRMRARGEDPTAEYQAGVDDLSRALELAPARAELWSARGAARVEWGDHLEGHGGRPDDLYRAAIEDISAAIARDAKRAPTWLSRGTAHAAWGAALAHRGEDPAREFEAAMADCGKALELDPADDAAWTRRGGMRVNWGFCLAARGTDPGELYGAAIADYAEALKRNPARAETWSQRGRARVNWGNFTQAHGRDPADYYGAAVEDLGQALKLAPGDDGSCMLRGLAQVNWANYLSGRGTDPGERYAAAILDYDEAIRRNPGRDENWIKRGIARANWGAYRIQHGGDPKDLYEAALADYAEAAKVNPGRDEIWVKRGTVHLNWAGWAVSRGADAEPYLTAAIDDLGKALAVNPNADETWMRRASAHVNRGVFAQMRGADPGPAYGAAIDDFGHALQLNAERDESWMGRASARLNWALWRDGRGEDPEDLLRPAIEDFGEAVKRNPGRADSWTRRGAARVTLARRASDPSTLRAGALADYEAGLAIKPNDLDALFQHADLAQALGKLDAALADYDRAEGVAPQQPRVYSNRALVLARAGRDVPAVADAERALGLDAQGAYYAYAARGLARLHQQRGKDALEDFARFESLAPADDSLRGEVKGWSEEARKLR